MRVRLPGGMARLACSKLFLLTLLALCHEGLSQKDTLDDIVFTPANPEPTPTCVSLYDVVKRTPELSTFLALINMVPQIKTLLMLPNISYTIIAPKNGVAPIPPKGTRSADVADYLLKHIINLPLTNGMAWFEAKALLRVDRLWPDGLLDIQIVTESASSVDPKTGAIVWDPTIEYTYVFLDTNTTDGVSGPTLDFSSNKPSPALLSCKGAVYVSDKALANLTVTPAPPTTCLSLYDVVKRTPQLSTFLALINMAPQVKTLLQLPSIPYTIIAPKNGVAPIPPKSTSSAVVADYLMKHIIKLPLTTVRDWARDGVGADRLWPNGWLNIQSPIGDDLTNKISYTYIFLIDPNATAQSSAARVVFQSNKPSPELLSCKGAVYVTTVPLANLTVPPTKPPACVSLYQVIKRTPNLSVLLSLIDKVPSVKQLLDNKNAVYTLIAPNNSVLLPNITYNAATLTQLLKLHVIVGAYPTSNTWVAKNGVGVDRLAGGKVNIEIAIGDDFANKIAYTYVFMATGNDTTSESGPRLVFQSNKPSPALLSCKGAVYVSDKAFTIPVPPPKPPACVSLYQVVKNTPSLSVLLSLVDKVPSVKQLLDNENAPYTLIAPNNSALLPNTTYNATTLTQLLNLHVIVGSYPTTKSWLEKNRQGLDRLAGGKVNVSIAIGDDFANGIGYTYVSLEPANDITMDFLNYPRIVFQDNTPDPGLLSCKGVVYVTDKAFSLVNRRA